MGENIFDIAVVGGGPAGMTAALYAARQGRNVVLIEKQALGGQALFSDNIENIPGISSISGAEWALNFEEQLNKYNVKILSDTVLSISTGVKRFNIVTTSGMFNAKSIILANGVKHRLPNIPNIENLIGHGVSVCATCDGDFYHDKVVAVIGGGNTAAQDALLLSQNGNKVCILQNLSMLTCEDTLKNRLENDPNTTICYNIHLKSISKVNTKIYLEDETSLWRVDGVFIAIGMAPDNERFSRLVVLDNGGFFGKPIVPGVFTAGDCRRKPYRQITTACADGTIAALDACAFLDRENL